MPPPSPVAAPPGRWRDDDAASWGLHAIGLGEGTGRGVRVAVLDTGFGPTIDFRGRTVTTRSFVPGCDVTDLNGHGTMCAGIACGGRTPRGRRYGIASEAHLYVGKVLTAGGVGRPEWVLAGLEWAIAEGCHVVSLSVGMDRHLPAVPLFEALARRALQRGTLVIAAAGDRLTRTVLAPATAPHVLAVGAVDADERPWDGAGPPAGGDGQVDVAAPGVSVFSSVPHPPGMPVPCYHTATGTSLAAPHAAGVAALLFERGLSAPQVWARLVEQARPLPHCRRQHVGGGLVTAP